MAVILEHFYHLIVIRSELRKKQNTNTMTSTSRDNTRTCLAMVSLSETEKRNAKILGSAIWWIPDAPRNGLRSEPGDSPVRDAVGQYAGPIECERFALLLQSDTSRYFVPCGGRGLGTAVSSQRRLPPPCGLLTPKPTWQRIAATNWSNNECSTVPYDNNNDDDNIDNNSDGRTSKTVSLLYVFGSDKVGTTTMRPDGLSRTFEVSVFTVSFLRPYHTTA